MPSQLQGESGILAAVRGLLEAGLSGRDAGAAWASLLAETSLCPLSKLDSWEQKIGAELGWKERNPPPPRWKFWNRPARFASWLDLCSRDGFRRERILRSLSEGAPNSFFCALALRRLNDWVPEVRAAARERLPRLVERSEPEHVVEALWHTFAHWTSWGRMEAADRQVLVELMSLDKVAFALKSRILRASAGPAALVLMQAGRGPAFDDWFMEFARTAIQPSVRAKAYRCLLEGRIVWVAGRRWVWTQIQWCKGRFEPILEQRELVTNVNFRVLLRVALEDKSSLVRRVAADFAIKRLDSLGSDAPSIAVQLASDSCRYVAEQGSFALNKLGGQP